MSTFKRKRRKEEKEKEKEKKVERSVKLIYIQKRGIFYHSEGRIVWQSKESKVIRQKAVSLFW